MRQDCFIFQTTRLANCCQKRFYKQNHIIRAGVYTETAVLVAGGFGLCQNTVKIFGSINLWWVAPHEPQFVPL